MKNVLTDIPIQRWICELEKLNIPEHDYYGWPGARSSSMEIQRLAYKAADVGLWRNKDRGWSTSTGTTTLADIVLIVDGREVGIFRKDEGSVIKFKSSSKKSLAMMEKIIALVREGVSSPVIDFEWEKSFLEKYPYSIESNFNDKYFIEGIQRLINTGRLWSDIWLADKFKSAAYRLILEGKCHRKML